MSLFKKLEKSLRKAVRNPTHSKLVRGVMDFAPWSPGSGQLARRLDKTRRKYGLTRKSILQPYAPVNSASSYGEVINPNRQRLSQLVRS